ncbi:MAG: SIMPL domain-containing protein [Bacteroidota bacterium]
MENNASPRPLRSLGLWLSAGIVFASIILGSSLSKMHAVSPFVDVKGLAEREVAADLVHWKLKFSVTAKKWSTLQKNMEKQTKTVVQFFHQAGFSSEEIIKHMPSIDERERFAGEDREKITIYKADMCVSILSSNIAVVQATLPKAETLVRKGVAIRHPSVRFSFTKLNDIKPDMIKEATLNARKAADQFAQDSGSKVGNIRHARQGWFSISDTARPSIKKVRVITDVRYTLND